jgi:hypothetical protein
MYSRLFGGGALSATRFSSQKWLKSSGLGGISLFGSKWPTLIYRV